VQLHSHRTSAKALQKAGCAWCRQAGGVEPLVLLLQGGQDKRAIKNASWALANLAKSNADNKAAIREAKGIQVRQPTLVAWLSHAVCCVYGCAERLQVQQPYEYHDSIGYCSPQGGTQNTQLYAEDVKLPLIHRPERV